MAVVFIIIMCVCITAVVCIDAINECFNSIIGFFFGIAFICAMSFLYDELNPTPKDTMDFCITDVFSWRGVYAQPCCSLSNEQTAKQENLAMLRRLVNEVFRGYKGGKYIYTFDDRINFECDCSDYSSGDYLQGFIKRNKDSEIINYIFR